MSKDHPKLCPICGSKFKQDHGLYCEYDCGSRYNYKQVALVRAPKECVDNQLENPATEFLYHGLDRAADAMMEDESQ